VRGVGPKEGGLLKKAARDFELARRYKDAKELVAASLLYNSAIERVLKALFMQKTHKNPPKSASIAYLAMRSDLPEGISEQLMSLEDERSDVEEEEREMEIAEEDVAQSVGQTEYNTVLDKGTIVKRLISYAQANK